jgi:prepilin-type N-terminal cleavage/methylation domain-containing protein
MSSLPPFHHFFATNRRSQPTRRQNAFSQHRSFSWRAPNGSSSRGFSLLEVVVSLLVMVIVSAGVMSAIVYGAALRSTASSYNGAMGWVQEQYSQVQSLSTSWNYAQLQLYTGSTLKLVNCPAGNCSQLVDNDLILVSGRPDQAFRVSALTSTSDGSTFTVSPPLTLTSGTRLGFSPLKFCSASSSTDAMAGQFNQALLPSAPLPTDLKTFGGRRYYLERTTSVTSVAPYYLLELTYQVHPENTPTTTVASLYTEVIPNAALHCP